MPLSSSLPRCPHELNTATFSPAAPSVCICLECHVDSRLALSCPNCGKFPSLNASFKHLAAAAGYPVACHRPSHPHR